MTCFGLAKALYELDFSYNVTSGIDFLSYKNQHIASYRKRQDIKTLYYIVKTLFTSKSNNGLDESDDKIQFNKEYNKFVSQLIYCTIKGYILKELLNRIGVLEVAYEDENDLSALVSYSSYLKVNKVITDDIIIENLTKMLNFLLKL